MARTMLTITNPKLQALYAYWSDKRTGRRFPARADLDPIEMRYVLGDLMLVDVLDDESLRFHIRLHGCNLFQHHGGELTGKMLDELPATERRELVTQTFTQVATTGEPMQAYREFVLDDRWAQYEAVVLPLSSDGLRVNMLLVGQIYSNR
jgi:hypothetical protein